MATRLQIGDYDNIAQVTDVPIVLTLVESDIREPDKKQASFAKPLQLYGTNEINILFENIFQVNIATQYFNPNIKTDISYYDDEVLQFEGYLQLLRIVLKPIPMMPVYECNVIGNIGNFFVDMGEALLEDLDMSHLDHDYTRENIVNSWDTEVIISGTPTAYAPGLGYYYPFVNRGTVLGDESIWKVSDFVPCIYKHEYLAKIFEVLGYTWESVVLDSEDFKREILYPNIDTISLSQSELDNRQFNVGRTGNITVQNTNGQITPIVSTDVYLNKETAPFFDTGGVYTAPYYTCNATGTYVFVGKLKLRISITHTNPLAVKSDNIRMTTFIETIKIKSNNGSGWVDAAVQLNNQMGTINPDTGLIINNDNFKTYFENNLPIEIPFQIGTHDMSVGTGDQLAFWHLNRVGITRDYSANPVRFYEADGTTLIVTGTANITVEIVADDNETCFYGLVTNKTVIEGDPLTINNALPKNIKQRDFVKSIINEWNLQIQPDKTDPKKLIIEPYVDYYDGDVVDWENKIDHSKEIIVTPLSELDCRKYIYKYKDDKDYYNELYLGNNGETFGTHEENIENDFIRNTKVTELIYSPTHNVANNQLGIAYPKIYQLDGSTVKRITPNIRSLYAKVKECTTNIIFEETGGTDLILNKYGYAGHTDDPFTPTLDINFGLPKQVYYSFLGASFTTNNRYNANHKPFIDQITHRDSKMVTAYLWLTKTDIEKFSFRNKFFVEDSYYRVNKIIDYSGEGLSTKCELLKLADVQVFTPEDIPIYDGITYTTERRIDTPQATPSINVAINTRYPVSVVGSRDIVIGRDAKYISIAGSQGISIADGVENVTVINTQNVEIEESNVIYNGGVKIYTSTKRYIANLWQSGTGDPTPIVFEHNFTVEPAWTKFAVGRYRATSTGEFPDADRVHIAGLGNYTDTGNPLIPIFDSAAIVGYYTIYWDTVNRLIMEVFDNTFTLVDLSTLIGTGKISLPPIYVYA